MSPPGAYSETCHSLLKSTAQPARDVCEGLWQFKKTKTEAEHAEKIPGKSDWK